MITSLLNKVSAKMQIALNNVCAKMQTAVDDERGDTNFISILIILGIVIILAGLFMGFKDTIVNQVREIMDGFTVH